jgi:hypothetical protein
MSITLTDVFSTLIASSLGATLAAFLIKKYYDRRLEFYFNSRLEELKAGLSVQGDVKNQLTTQRLEIYPAIAASVYRLRNNLRELNQSVLLTVDTALTFVRLAEEYTEQIYSSRFFLEIDLLFEPLHEYKNQVLAAKNLLLDWIHLAQNEPEHQAEIRRVLDQLQGIYPCLDEQHEAIIHSLTRLEQGRGTGA